MTHATRLRVADNPMRGWQAPYAHVWAANNMRAMPENEIPPASPGDHYFLNRCRRVQPRPQFFFRLCLVACCVSSIHPFPEPRPPEFNQDRGFSFIFTPWPAASAASTFFLNRCRRGSTKTAVFLSSLPRGLLRQRHPPFS